MKLLHICPAGPFLPSARAARRLHAALLRAGHESKCADWMPPETVHGTGVSDEVFHALQRWHLDAARKDVEAGSFSIGYGRSHAWPDACDWADVIHLHDPRVGMDIPEIERLLDTGKPVLFGLPDSWIFTGGCHHPMGCSRFSGECASCPQLSPAAHPFVVSLLADKTARIGSRAAGAFAFSREQLERAAGSPLFNKVPLYLVDPPPLPAQSDNPTQTTARKLLGLDPHARVILFLGPASASPAVHQFRLKKLLREFMGYGNAFRRLASGEVAVLLCGAGDIGQAAPWLQTVPDDGVADIHNALIAADFLVLPAVEENHAPLFVEAAGCGTRVLALQGRDAGGFLPGAPGLVAGDTTRHLAEALCAALDDSGNGPEAPACRPTPEDSCGDWLRQYELAYSRSVRAGCNGPRRGSPTGGTALTTASFDALVVAVQRLGTSNEHSSAEIFKERSAKYALVKKLDTKLAFFEKWQQRLAGMNLPDPAGTIVGKSLVSLGKLRNQMARLIHLGITEQSLQPPGTVEIFAAIEGEDPRNPANPATPLWVTAAASLTGLLGAGRRSGCLGTLDHHPPLPLRHERFPKPVFRTKELPTIAIVTPSFGQASFLEKTISSVLEQAYPKLRYAVQDGGSTDGTSQILERWKDRLSSCESSPDTGQAGAIAVGFQKIDGEVMAWLNSDDFLMPGALRFIGEYFKRHPTVDVIYAHRVLVNEQGMETGRWILPPHDPEVLRWIDYVPQETLFWREKIWRAVGGIDPSFRFAMDWDLLLRFQSAGAKIVRIPYFTACFRVHGDQKTSSQLHTLGAEEMALLLRREHGRTVRLKEIDPWQDVMLRRSSAFARLADLGMRV